MADLSMHSYLLFAGRAGTPPSGSQFDSVAQVQLMSARGDEVSNEWVPLDRFAAIRCLV